MLQDMRDKVKGVTAGILVALLVLPLAFVGIDSFFLSGPDVDQAASVNGEKITQFEVEQGVALRRQQILSQFEGIDPALLGDDQLREPVIDALIRESVLHQQARRQGMTISDETFRDVVISQDAFKQDGRFDPAVYEYAIGRLGYTPRTYRQRVEQELLVNQFMGGVFASAFISPVEFEKFLKLSLEERDFHYLTLSLDRFREGIEVSEDDIARYYAEKGEAFDEPERVSIEYIALNSDSLVDKVEVSEEQIRAQFDAEVAAGGDATRWHVAHIQLEERDDGSHRAVIDEITARLAAGEDFGELARAFSEDAGSAQQGGDLGTFTPGTLPESFESALGELEPGEVSGVVQGDDALHLIKLIARSEGETPDYAAQRDRIRNELAVAGAVDLLPRYVEDLKEKTYNVETLGVAAEELGLELGVTEPFARTGGDGVAANTQVVEAAFGEDVLEHGFASEVMELQDQHYLVVKLKEHLPAHRKPLAEVKDRIVAILRDVRAAELADEAVAEIEEALRGGATVEAVAVERDLPWQVVLKATRFEAAVSTEVLQAVFSHTGSALPAVGQVATAGGDRVVFALSRVRDGDGADIGEEERRRLRDSLEQMQVSREWRAYEDSLLAEAEIDR